MLGTPRLYAEQIPALWRFGPVTVATHHHDDSMAAIAERIVAAAPPRFALAGLSMGGYLAFEIVRQAGHRVTRLALLNTAPRSDTPEQTRRRRDQISRTQAGHFGEVVGDLCRLWVRDAMRGNRALERVIHQMADETGPEAFVRQQIAIMNRPDSRPDLAAIGCPTLVVAGSSDEVTTPEQAADMTARIPGARLVVVPDCGHLSTLEQPAALTQILLDWLRQ